MKYIERLLKFVHEELDDYSYFEGWELIYEEEEGYGGYERYNLEIKENGKYIKDVRFRINKDQIEVDHGEDCWNIANTHDYRVKYFWMALLSWDF